MLLMSLLVFSGALFAQDKSFFWGPKAALHLSNFYGSDVDGAKIKVGYQVGLMAEYQFNSWFAVSPELMFSAQGCKIKTTFDGDEYKATDYLNYINLPIMAKFYVCKPLSIDFGPALGLAVYNKVSG